jgi:ABC-type nitrate/sulfonate/bicarbonate transport system substrate-binding protein
VGSLQNRTSALISGAIDGGLAQPPDQLALEDHGLHVIYDMAAQQLPSAGDCVVVQKSWLDANHDVAQRYIDSLVMATARAKQDKPGTLQVLAKYLKTDDQRALSTTYDFFVGQVLTLYPIVAANQFADTVDQLSQTNPDVKNVDLTTLLDNSLVQDAMSRNVGG